MYIVVVTKFEPQWSKALHFWVPDPSVFVGPNLGRRIAYFLASWAVHKWNPNQGGNN